MCLKQTKWVKPPSHSDVQLFMSESRQALNLSFSLFSQFIDFLSVQWMILRKYQYNLSFPLPEPIRTEKVCLFFYFISGDVNISILLNWQKHQPTTWVRQDGVKTVTDWRRPLNRMYQQQQGPAFSLPTAKKQHTAWLSPESEEDITVKKPSVALPVPQSSWSCNKLSVTAVIPTGNKIHSLYSTSKSILNSKLKLIFRESVNQIIIWIMVQEGVSHLSDKTDASLL